MTVETLALGLVVALAVGAIVLPVARAAWRSSRRRREFARAYAAQGKRAAVMLSSERPRVLAEPTQHRFARGDRYPTRMDLPVSRHLSPSIPPAPLPVARPRRALRAVEGTVEGVNDDRWLKSSLELHVNHVSGPEPLSSSARRTAPPKRRRP